MERLIKNSRTDFREIRVEEGSLVTDVERLVICRLIVRQDYVIVVVLVWLMVLVVVVKRIGADVNEGPSVQGHNTSINFNNNIQDLLREGNRASSIVETSVLSAFGEGGEVKRRGLTVAEVCPNGVKDEALID